MDVEGARHNVEMYQHCQAAREQKNGVHLPQSTPFYCWHHYSLCYTKIIN